MKLATYEEFSKAVYKDYIESWSGQDEKEVELAKRYFKSEEANNVLKSRYKSAINKIKAGGNPKHLMGAEVSAVSYCLQLMME